MAHSHRQPRPAPDPAADPFPSVEAAWFWCVQARTAQIQGARLAAGMSDRPKPCEPLDILAVVDRLYRRRRLLAEHVQVLAEYGRQLLPPDPDSRRERRAAALWAEALAALAPPLQDKGIVA
jgi:hypothetical protein